ncbi:MAG: flagellar basal body rod protein FlgB [bacterium]|nr:flagellar basal body rod protein FlgB [bacterium]
MLEMFNDENHILLKKMLDISTERHRVVSHNIANVNTPGFNRADIKFEDELKTALEGDSGLIADLPIKSVKTSDTPLRHDGNNVDLNKELAIVAQNTIMYNLYIQFMHKRFNSLEQAMQGPQ